MNSICRSIPLFLALFISACGGGGGGGNAPPPNPPPPVASADLASLTLSDGALSPAFSRQVLIYTAAVPESTTSITVTPRAIDPNARIEVNGTQVVSGTASAAISTPLGDTVVTITVSSGALSQTTNVTASRSDATAPVATVSFPGDGFTSASSIDVTGTSSDALGSVALVEVNGIAATTSDGFATWRAADVPLSSGDNTLTVTTEDAPGNRNPQAVSVLLRRTELLAQPRGIAIDGANNRAWVSDIRTNTVYAVDLTSGNAAVLSGSGTGSGPALLIPLHLVFDAGNNRLLVAQDAPNGLVSIDLTTGDRTVINAAPIDLAATRGMVLDSANNRVLLPDFGRSDMRAIDLTTGVLTDWPNIPGDLDYGNARAIEIDSANNRVLLPFPSSTDRLYAVDLTSGAFTSVSDPISGFGPRFFRPYDVVLDAVGNRVFVSDGRPAIFEIDLATGTRSVLSGLDQIDNFTINTIGAGRLFEDPVGLIYDEDNARLIAADSSTFEVWAVDTTTGDRSLALATEASFGSSLFPPSGLAYDAVFDRVLVTRDSISNPGFDPARVLGIERSTGRRGEVSGPLAGGGDSLQGPTGIDVDPGSNRAIVKDQAGGRNATAIDLGNGNRTTISDLGDGTVGIEDDLVIDAVGNRALYPDSGGSVRAVDLTTGAISILSDDLTGSGPLIGGIVGIGLDTIGNRAIVVGPSAGGLISVDLATGDRVQLTSDTIGSGTLLSNGRRLVIDETNGRALIADDDLDAVIAVELATGDRTIVSSPAVGRGPVFRTPAGIDLDGNGLILLLDQAKNAVFVIEPESGDRFVLSR